MQGVIFTFIKVMLGIFKTDGKSRAEVTRTYYDTAPFPITWQGQTINQDNLRTRVASVTYQENPGTAYDQASHYSYDVHGNVKSLVVEIDNKKLTKRLDYDYDLVSGKVNTVTYQAGQSDQFIHRYEYDSDNRITKVFTSKDGVLWDNDAKYQYYAHGPLARTVTGELAVETQNFAYTLQGWIKGLNGQNFSYALGYNSTDYTAIGTANNLTTDIATGKDLYNGNIATWTSKNSATPNGTLQTTPWTQQFEYDQLNRIKVGTTLSGSNNYKNTYNYDPNGNILALQRWDGAGNALDALTYNYHNTDKGYKENTNRLRSVDDAVNNGTTGADLKDMGIDNYQYDETGNLVFDASEEIDKIEWTLSGKVKSIARKTGSTKDNLSFTYDPTGQRVSKTVTPSTGVVTTTYYVRDAGGNILATYNNTTLQEHDVYGSSRLGIAKTNQKAYELTDHLGNVRTVLNDNGLVASATDYYPFGMVASNYATDKYAYSFNGQMKVEELGASHTTAEFWEYDGRLGRRWNLDPKPQTGISVYSCFANNPIWFTDLLGDTVRLTDNFKKSESSMKAYNAWSQTKAGKKFLKDYEVGGKLGNTSVVFDAKDIGYGSGQLNVYSVDSKGTETEIVSPDDKNFDKNKHLVEPKKGEFARYTITLATNETFDKLKTDNPNLYLLRQVQGGLTVLHETQHLRMSMASLNDPNYKKLIHPYLQHTYMKKEGGFYFNERKEYIMQYSKYYRKMFGNDYIKIQNEAINAFDL